MQECLSIQAEGNQGLTSLERHTPNDLKHSTFLKGSATSQECQAGTKPLSHGHYRAFSPKLEPSVGR